ncbi:hypothetical protein Celaphus_00009687 [Cervus elaphus hippelaphus]|uniref:Uncharacterized protein n=1 Tax=Cervus elaphus hippelaphus TaxID=46360 RepID=A0A212C0G0_CEREH|nr:hypothetical protein Celaphus_00009687 [Cervus elaphus hippelaphus]
MRPCQSGSGSAEGEDGHRAPEGQDRPGRGRALMEAAKTHPQGERAPRAPGPGGDVAPVAVRHRCGVLVLRWTAEDLAFIRISINPFLDQLSLVIQSIRSLGIPPFLG